MNKHVTELVTKEMCENLGYGAEIKLDEDHTLYKYTEDDYVSIFTTEDWDELYAVLYGGAELIFESLI